MTREISNDGNVLINYLDQFNLKDSLKNPQYINSLKSMHKKAYGYLLFVAEMEQLQASGISMTSSSLLYYKETGSDLIQSIFCWTLGSYKTANIMLRSSIETFLKAVLGNTNEEIYDEKSIYRLFEIASDHPCFGSDLGKELFGTIHSMYKELCMVAHSAKNIDLGTIASLDFLPRFDLKLSNSFNSKFLRLLDTILGFIMLNHSNEIQKMHSLNKSVFLSTITFTTKRKITEVLAVSQS